MAKLLYAGEHPDSPNYDNRLHPAIEEKFMEQGQSWEVQPWVNKIIFILEGEIEYSTGESGYYVAHKGQFLFLAANRSLSVHAGQGAHLGIIRLYDKIQLCDSFHLENLTTTGQAKANPIKGSKKHFGDNTGTGLLLTANPIMERYLEILTICHRQGLKSRYYNECKIRELMFILRAFYSKEDLYRFFYPALTTDTWFSQFIMSNYNKYDDLAGLAAAMNYTVSGFEKKFRKVFYEAPYTWMRRQRAQEAYHYIKTSDKSFKEIAEIFGFSTPPAFIRFIRENFGMTPGEIRKKSRKGGNE
ncbi:AraC family transcriptional regulator [Dysgonomonas sp. 521]|uniref:helix-turn-helix transcriptional regulator n=1 Tax=Dysgonomonas sp. 521 TaxID=2302932 RepID=UPI0013D552D1|nr:AraC family transcriptional regulator [Dysgonomonas sp. 521]NDV95419.1 AraC family transcriptional regulator [Dysgonomonas sp. 521]